MSKVVHKTKIVPFIKDAAGKWVQIKKSTAFSLSLNPQTKTYDYISDKLPTEEIDSYQPSLDQEIVMNKGEADYDVFFDLFYSMPTSDEAHRDVLIVFYQEEGTREKTPAVMDTDGVTVLTPAVTEPCFKSWLCDALIKCNSLDSVNSSISINLSFSNIRQGVAIKDNAKTIDFIEGSANTWSTSK